MNTQSSRLVCVDLFFVRFPMNSRSISKPVEAGFVGFHGNVLDKLCPVEPFVDGPGLPTAPSGLNGRGFFSCCSMIDVARSGFANGIISHFDLTFVLVETLRDVRKLHVNLSVGASRGASQRLETFGV